MWDNAKILKLVELYHKNEVLWNTKHYNYKYFRYSKLDIWKQIADELQVERSDAERKMHHLRSQFTREYKAVRTAKRNGEEFTPTWFAYKPMAFLIDYTGVREEAARVKKLLETDTNKEAVALAQVTQEEQKEEQSVEVLLSDSSENLISNYESSSNLTPMKRKRKKKRVDEQTIPAVCSQECSRMTMTDDYSVFAEYISRELRKIKDDTILATAKHHITNVLFESQMKYYESRKNKREDSPGGPSNYISEKDICTSIELLPVKFEVNE